MHICTLANKMWRQNIYKGNADSDQSISDEEDFSFDFPENGVSLSEHTKKEEGLELQSKLEILKGAHGLAYKGKASNLSYNALKHTNFAVEDEGEVEVPDSLDDSDLACSLSQAFTCNSDEEAISDDEANNAVSVISVTTGIRKVHKDNLCILACQKQERASTWSEISKETGALIHLNENTSCSSSHSAYSKANKSYKGIKGKAKPKLSFRFPSHKEGRFSPDILKDKNDAFSKVHDVPEDMEITDCGNFKDPTVELLEDFHGNNVKYLKVMPAEGQAPGHGFVEHSMAELLDGLQDHSSLLKGNSKMCHRTRGKRVQPIVKRNTATLGDRTIDSEDFPDPVACELSSDEEVSHQTLILAIPETKRPTITDQFQEALGATSLSNEGALTAASKPSCIGLFGRLQEVMQSDKESDMVFTKNLQFETSLTNGASFINVKILARYLDAKLTVCQCSYGTNTESSQWAESPQATVYGERKRTIIFNPRVCGDVDLEVGNLIRIHPPWKEVQVIGNDESILLCTYFSQLSTSTAGLV